MRQQVEIITSTGYEYRAYFQSLPCRGDSIVVTGPYIKYKVMEVVHYVEDNGAVSVTLYVDPV